MTLVDAASDPVTCAYWSKTDRGRHQLAEPAVGLGAAGAGSRCAPSSWSAGRERPESRWPPGTGYFTQTVGGGAAAPAAGSLFWVSDTGVRYGIDNESDNRPAAGGSAKRLRPLV